MKTPFTFGKIVSETDFTNRVVELNRLSANFSSSVNTIIISSRRWGKSSLVAKAANQIQKKSRKILFCMVDLNHIRSEEQFYEILATKILQESSNSGFSPDQGTDFSLSPDSNTVRNDPGDILDLAERVAVWTKKEIIICIDEFQNISEFENPVDFQKKLSAHWQSHQHVAYCLYGSKRQMLIDIFSTPAMPFYKFGDIILLGKIKEKEWINFISKRFIETGKKIQVENAARIAKYCENHPDYVQQLAQQVWLRTPKKCKSKIIREAFEGLVMQMSMLFQMITDELTMKQISFLNAIIDGEEHVTSQGVLMKYNLGTSANVVKIKRTLQDREIIDIIGRRIEFMDPLYKYWLKKYYFK